MYTIRLSIRFSIPNHPVVQLLNRPYIRQSLAVHDVRIDALAAQSDGCGDLALAAGGILCEVVQNFIAHALPQCDEFALRFLPIELVG